MARNTVGARELKARLGRYLRSVRQGETLIVTDRGEPIAELRPLREDFDGKLARLRAAGKVSGGAGMLRPIRRAVMRGTDLSSAILEDRDDRF